MIVWDWGWNDSNEKSQTWDELASSTNWASNEHGDATDTIRRLPNEIELMSVSEWEVPIQRGGIKSKLSEYSISVVSPGPRATRHWQLAKERGLKTVAKVQFNNSWELASVPYLPVMDLIAEHCSNLARAKVDGMMLSWTLGGYPSLNLQVAREFSTNSDANKENVLNTIATQHFGPAAAPSVRRAWTAFSDAIKNYPLNINVLYNGPHHMGPANLLYGQPTGYRATMLGIPYDDINAWRGPYPAEILADLYERVATGWALGLTHLEEAVRLVPQELLSSAVEYLGVAKAAFLHFASAANQIRFVLARNELLQLETVSDDYRKRREDFNRILADEISLACELFALAQKDSRLGFEASNHYFYVPLDLVEKVISCKSLERSQ